MTTRAVGVQNIKFVLFLFAACFSCAKQPRLPLNSKYNVTCLRNDSTWFATGEAIRLFSSSKRPASIKQFDLQIITDINFPGNGSKGIGKSPYVTGCVDGSDCVPTQRLHIYNIPLKRGKYKISKLDKRRKFDLERTTYWLMVGGSGVQKQYQYVGRNPGWIRITGYDRQTNLIEGTFSMSLDDKKLFDKTLKNVPQIARFREGLFRVKLIDVMLKNNVMLERVQYQRPSDKLIHGLVNCHRWVAGPYHIYHSFFKGKNHGKRSEYFRSDVFGRNYQFCCTCGGFIRFLLRIKASH